MIRKVTLELSEASQEMCMKRIAELNMPNINSIEDYIAFIVLKDGLHQ